MKLRKVHKRLLLGLLLIVGAGLIFYFFSSSKFALPSEFLAARQDAALVSQKIVDLTDMTGEKIKAINLSDFDGDVNKAINLIREARESNSAAYEKASELARHLQKLAESLSGISSRDAQRSAYEAVAVELSLVSEFIVYTQELGRFFDTLSRAVATDAFADRNAVSDRLKQVNEQAQKINTLNKEFISKISEFDESL